jgi:hypothetical protein
VHSSTSTNNKQSDSLKVTVARLALIRHPTFPLQPKEMALLARLGALSLIAASVSEAAILPKRASAFLQAKCDVVQDIGKLSSVRWSEAQADAVLGWANRNWNEEPGSSGETHLDYINTMFRLFGKPSANCAIAEGSCDFSDEVCLDKDDWKKGEDAPVGKTPGAWAIRQSLSHIHSVRIYHDIQNSAAN